jgi:hypothetical protein
MRLRAGMYLDPREVSYCDCDASRNQLAPTTATTNADKQRLRILLVVASCRWIASSDSPARRAISTRAERPKYEKATMPISPMTATTPNSVRATTSSVTSRG